MNKRLVLLAFLNFYPVNVFAAGKVYRINDCNGSPQQIGTVDTLKTEIIAEFPETEIPPGINVQLKNVDTLQLLQQPLKEKKISFLDVSEGEWELCTTPSKRSFINVEIK